MSRKQRRFALIGFGLAVVAVAVGLMLNKLNDSLVFFYSPSEVIAKAVRPGERIRLGGLVETGSVQRGPQLAVRFSITDGGHAITVAYTGFLPDLFREGQGVVTEGSLGADGVFHANVVLAKHDETYMPRDVSDALKKQGHWQTQYGKPAAAGGSPPAAPTAGRP